MALGADSKYLTNTSIYQPHCQCLQTRLSSRQTRPHEAPPKCDAIGGRLPMPPHSLLVLVVLGMWPRPVSPVQHCRSASLPQPSLVPALSLASPAWQRPRLSLSVLCVCEAAEARKRGRRRVCCKVTVCFLLLGPVLACSSPPSSLLAHSVL